jgi:hypothetical protein
MPSIDTVRNLLATRYVRSFEAWAERVTAEIGDATSGSNLCIVARLTRDPETGPRLRPLWSQIEGEIARVERALGITVVRFLGVDEFVVRLGNHQDQNQLALRGHLEVTRDGFRMTAI